MRYSIFYTRTFIFLTDGFPEDFSILATIRARRRTRGFLFTMYSGMTSGEVLGLELPRGPFFLYEDHKGLPGNPGSPRFDANADDDE